MSPTQTSGRDSFGWRLRCPFRYLPILRGGAEGSYGIEDRDRVQIGSKIKGKTSGSEEGAGETEKRGESRVRQGGARQTGREACRREAYCSCQRHCKACDRQAAGEQCR